MKEFKKQAKKVTAQNNERGNEMKRTEKMSNAAQNSKKGDKTMIRNSQKVNEGFDRKLGTARQQNLVEMIGYIYLYPQAHTKESLAWEFTKNGKTNERKVLRMISDVNTFCPIIKRVLGEIDQKSHYYIDKKRFSETDLDNFYQKAQNAELLYIFLEALLIKPISTEEVMKKLNVSRKKANQMINKILDATYVIDDVETSTGYVIGYNLY